MIVRHLQETLESRFFRGKALLVMGPRQSGKSTLVEDLLKSQQKPWLYFNGDEAHARSTLKSHRL